MKRLNKRQGLILDYINQNSPVARLEVEEYISSVFDKISKATVIRDLSILLDLNYIKKQGSTRSIRYYPKEQSKLLIKYDAGNCFKVEADSRKTKYTQFDFDIFNNLKNLLSDDEIEKLEKINQIYVDKIKKLPPALLKKEYEKLLIEFSWKSSQIEGSTYSLFDAEVLIKENIEAKGHKKEEAIMILNHKGALEFIFANRNYFKTLTFKKIEKLHTLLTNKISTDKGLRKYSEDIALDNVVQIKSVIDSLIKTINSIKSPIEKALATAIMISYIQPFKYGNKITGRILANAVLFSHGYCPLSYRSVDESEYKKAVIIFYENGSLECFKNLFVEQFKFAVSEYFRCN